MSEATIVGKLTRIVVSEGVEADADALALIARLADGGMRDAESLLDQVLSFAAGRVTADEVREAVGLADDAAIAALIDAYVAADAPAALARVADLADAGRDMAQVASQAEQEARRRLLASAADPSAARRLATILRTVAEAAGVGAREGRARLLLELLSVEPAAPLQAVSQPAARPAPAPRALPAAPVERPASVAAEQPRRPQPAARVEVPATRTLVEAADVGAMRSQWAEVVDRANPVLKPLLRECRPVARDGARLTLAFPEGRDFIRSRIAQRAGAIETLLTDMFGGSFAIECVASNLELEPLTVEQALVPDATDPDAQALLEGVLKITGGELVDAPEVR